MLTEILRSLRQGAAPVLVLLAGPNGAGKSTFYAHFLAAEGLPFINADLIARDLAYFRPEAVGDVAPAAVRQATEPFRMVAIYEQGVLVEKRDPRSSWAKGFKGLGRS